MEVALLTATIAPNPATFMLKRSAAVERLADYMVSLDFYLNELARGTFDYLVFVDNSGHPLDALKSMAHQRGLADKTSFVTVSPCEDIQFGRCFLEIDLLNKAFYAEPLSLFGPDTRFWKVTGRYLVRNVRTIIRSAPADTDVYVNSRSVRVRWTDLYLAAFTAAGYRRVFYDDHELYRNTVPGEQILFRRLGEIELAPLKVVRRMRRVPRLEGVRGFDGRRYGDMKGKMGYAVRVVANRLAPWLWI